jgi:hypothetical protein
MCDYKGWSETLLIILKRIIAAFNGLGNGSESLSGKIEWIFELKNEGVWG